MRHHYTDQFSVQKPVDLLPTGTITPQAFGDMKQRCHPRRKSDEAWGFNRHLSSTCSFSFLLYPSSTSFTTAIPHCMKSFKSYCLLINEHFWGYFFYRISFFFRWAVIFCQSIKATFHFSRLEEMNTSILSSRQGKLETFTLPKWTAEINICIHE